MRKINKVMGGNCVCFLLFPGRRSIITYDLFKEVHRKDESFLEISFYFRYEMQRTGKMMEGTVPVPPHRPCAKRDDTVVPGGLSHFSSNHKAAWDKLLLSVYWVLNSSYKNRSIQIV